MAPVSSVLQPPANTGNIKPHPSFDAIPRDKAGLYVWRIVNLDLEKVPDNRIGSFYSGDCYLVLAVMNAKMSDIRIHFWIGAQSSVDESATAAIMAVALDDYFGGSPMQTREVQDSESGAFMQYFEKKGGVRYLEGGVASGLRHAESRDSHMDALFQVKGSSAKNCRVIQVPLAWQSFNEGDSFVLDVGAVIFVWTGKYSRKSESFSAARFAQQLRHERGLSKCVVVFAGDGTESVDLSEAYLEMWNKYLPLDEKKVLPESASGNDAAVVRQLVSAIKLYCCKEGSNGETTLSEVKNGPLSKDDLKSDDVFIVDNGAAGVWAWIGRTASKNERRFAMHFAGSFVTDKGYPPATRVSRVIDGGEPAEFRALFARWPVTTGAMAVGSANSFNRIATPAADDQFDAATLHRNPKLAAQAQMMDDGSADSQIYRVERNSSTGKYELVEQAEPVFYGGDAYLVVYGSKQQPVIYYWLGRHSTGDEQAACAVLAVEVDNERFDGRAVQVRVCQAKEPRHLMAIFNGLLTIFDGGKAGWAKDDRDKAIGDTYLLQVHCASALDRKAIQVPLSAQSLNSSDAFVLVSGQASQAYVWAGQGSTEEERQLAARVARRCQGADAELVVEGSESDQFWAELGGKKAYASSSALKTAASAAETALTLRLFQCSNRLGRFGVEEVTDFSQDDLVVDDVMLLDTSDAIYVWLGQGSNKQERQASIAAAAEYLKSDPRGRDQNVPIFVVKQGSEPLSFTGYFTAWDSKLWSSKSFDQLRSDMGGETEEMQLSIQQIEEMTKALGVEPDFDSVQKFTYDQLKQSDALPAEVNPLHREKHLSAEEFERVFGMTYKQFLSKPAWQRTRAKKEAELF